MFTISAVFIIGIVALALFGALLRQQHISLIDAALVVLFLGGILIKIL